MNCGYYRAMKILDHDMKVVSMLLEDCCCRIVAVNEMQFGFLPEKGTIDAVFILRWQEEYFVKGK